MFKGLKAYVYVAVGRLGPELHVAWKPGPFIFWIVKIHLTLLPWGNVDRLWVAQRWVFYMRITLDSNNFAAELLCYRWANMCKTQNRVWDVMMQNVVAWNWICLVYFSYQYNFTFWECSQINCIGFWMMGGKKKKKHFVMLLTWIPTVPVSWQNNLRSHYPAQLY